MTNTSEQVLNMDQPHEQQEFVHNREGHCPTCGHYAEFIFLGVQRWPARLVEVLGCPPETYLFTCGQCNTTVSESDIES